MPSAGPAAVPAPRPRDRRDPWLRVVPEEVVTPPPAGRPGHGSGAVLRRQPVRIVHGRFEGGYTDVYEIVCPMRTGWRRRTRSEEHTSELQSQSKLV